MLPFLFLGFFGRFGVSLFGAPWEVFRENPFLPVFRPTTSGRGVEAHRVGRRAGGVSQAIRRLSHPGAYGCGQCLHLSPYSRGPLREGGVGYVEQEDVGAAYTGEFWLPQSPLRIWLAVTTPMPARVHSLAQDRKGLWPGPAVTYPMASAFSFFFLLGFGERGSGSGQNSGDHNLIFLFV